MGKKSDIDKQIKQGIEEGLTDICQGRTYGPFDTAESMIESLNKQTNKRNKSRQQNSEKLRWRNF